MTRLSDLFQARLGREPRLRAALGAGLATMLLAAGCGGGSGSGSSSSTSATDTQASAPPAATTTTRTSTAKTGTTKTTSTTSTGTTSTSAKPSPAKRRPAPRKTRTKPKVILDRETSAYLRAAVGRDSLEVFASSIAGQRTSNPAVRKLTQDISRQRGLEIVDLRASATAQHVQLPKNPLSVANSRLIQRLVPLRGKALDQAYLAMERANITAAIAQASSAQQSASAKLRARLTRYLKAYRSQLATVDSLRGSG